MLGPILQAGLHAIDFAGRERSSHLTHHAFLYLPSCYGTQPGLGYARAAAFLGTAESLHHDPMGQSQSSPPRRLHLSCLSTICS